MQKKTKGSQRKGMPEDQKVTGILEHDALPLPHDQVPGAFDKSAPPVEEELTELQKQWLADEKVKNDLKEAVPTGVVDIPFEDDEMHVNLTPCTSTPLNGSGKVIVQYDNRGLVRTKSNIILNQNIMDQQKKSEHPMFKRDAMFHVVNYDPDINLRYRFDKLKWMRKKDWNELQHGKQDIEARKELKAMEDAGMLDILRIGDQVFFQHENWMPVELRVGLNTYYIAHHMDILTIKKQPERLRGERPDLYPEAFKEIPVQEPEMKVVK